MSTKRESKDQINSPAVLITGALTGIGRAAALAFAREGARIVASGRHDDKGKALASELQALGVEATFIKSDVRHEDEVRALIDETVKRFGRMDVAVNNAGTEGKLGPFTDQTAESYAATFDTNVLGTLLSMKHELRAMLPQGSGSIVNVSSTYGRAGAPGAAIYVASKHAVEGFTKAVGETAPGLSRAVGMALPTVCLNTSGGFWNIFNCCQPHATAQIRRGMTIGRGRPWARRDFRPTGAARFLVG
jgi:NAD(P)-dependent dehydrogenase (short-subunit alcohol dehydrogenase family)